MAKKILAIGLKRAMYAEVVAAGIPTTFIDIDVIHDETFEFTMTEAVYEDYINMLTKKRYHRRKTEDGQSNIAFSIGQYDLLLKKVFMGGTVTPATTTQNEKWVPGDGAALYKAIRVVTEDDVQITFPYASVSANHNRNLSAMGLGIDAAPVSHPDGVTPMEEWEILGTKTA